MARARRRPGNLPAEVTTFVGRRRELAELRSRLSTARVVILVGPGGVGKTRLAIRVATDLARGFGDGAWLIGLAQVRDPALVAHSAGAALGLRDHAAVGGTTALLRSFLADKELLLVVDNCEHVLAAAAQLVTEIVEAAPEVRVVATSREPLSVPGEYVLPVPPLELPAADQPLHELAQNEAVTLFAQRAEAASGSFALTAANQAAVVGLCRRLDGLPLAIELAAVRTRVLAPQQILQHLTDRFGVLAAGGGAALPRHQTLRTTLDWSHDLLDADERMLLRRLSVFAGRFTLDDVEGVCAGEDLPASRVLGLLSSLVDKSLVTKQDARAVAVHRLHETTREYARLKLQGAGEADVLAERCAEYYAQRCYRRAPEARYRLVEWLEWLDLEIDNIRAVLQGCLSRADAQRGADLAASLSWYWITRATTEGAHWLDLVLQVAPADSAEAPPHAGAHFMRGFLAVLQADPTTAGLELQRAATAARDTDQVRLLAESLAMGSVAANMAGDRGTGRRLLRQAGAVVTRLDDLPARLALLQARAVDGFVDGDLDTFRSASAEGARRSRAAGDLYTLQIWLMNQGFAALTADTGEDPEPPLTEALRIAQQIDDRLAQSYLFAALGCHAAATGEPHRAATLFGASDVLRGYTGARVNAILAPLLAVATENTRTALGGSIYDTRYEEGRRSGRHATVGVALREPARRPARAAFDAQASPLAKRETEVAHLVADGLTNRQIGTRLFISERTVENHVRHIMDKLGFTSRTQIAGWIANPDS